MVRTSNLLFSYNNERNFAYPDFEVKAGEPLAFTGKSGCGKTTLLHLLAGLLVPTSGSVWIDESDLTKMNAARLDAYRGQKIGIVFQRPHFIQSLTVRDNILAAPFFARVNINNKQLEHTAAELGIAHLLHRMPSSLSIGEQQRAAIARAIVHKPALVLADEPTSSLDDDNCHEVLRLLTELSGERQAALVIVTHDDRVKRFIQNQVSLS
jgi:putative ABC transport system ATP-binding protein